MTFSHIAVIRDKQISLNMNVMELENDIKSMGDEGTFLVCPFVHPCTTKQANKWCMVYAVLTSRVVNFRPTQLVAQGPVFWPRLRSLNRG